MQNALSIDVSENLELRNNNRLNKLQITSPDNCCRPIHLPLLFALCCSIMALTRENTANYDTLRQLSTLLAHAFYYISQ